MQQEVYVTFTLTTVGTCFREVYNAGDVNQTVNIEENPEDITGNAIYITLHLKMLCF